MKYSIYIYLAHQDSLPRGCKHQMTAYVALVPADRVIAGDNVNAEQAAAQNAARLTKRQRDLRTAVSRICLLHDNQTTSRRTQQ